MLRLEDVSRSFGGLAAVSGLSIDIPEKSITGLIGPNGAGKTTVVNLITGILKLDAGRIRLDGNDLSTSPAHVVARAGIARTFQNIRLLPEASVLENVVIGFHAQERTGLIQQILGLPSSRRETRHLFDRAHAMLDQFHMSRFAFHPAGSLAYGHQRRVEIMRAVASQPKMLLLDEPVAGMNDVEAAELGAHFAALATQGIGLLLIEHNIRFVSQLCEKVYVLESGSLIASGGPQQVLNNPAVITAYLGR